MFKIIRYFFFPPALPHLDTYLRLLEMPRTTRLQADMEAAVELIEAGHATGKFTRSKGRDDYGCVLHVVNFAPTFQGRLYADELRAKKKRSAWKWRVIDWSMRIICVVVGWGMDIGKEIIVTMINGPLC